MKVRLWAALVAIALLALGFELFGVFNHDAHEVDTYSELWWWIRDRASWASVPLAVGLAGFLGWLWWHLILQRRRR